MKKKLLILSLVFIGIITKPLSAQVLTDGAKNVVKLNLFALGLNNISLQYERALHKNISVALQVGFIPSHGLPTQIESQVPSDLSKLKFSAFNITPEVRIYPGKKELKQAPRGFYFAPYYRYMSFSVSGFVTYPDSSNYPIVVDRSASGSFTLKGSSFGLQLGYQWIIANKVSIDWWILGFHGGVGKAIGNFNADNSSGAEDMQQQFSSMELAKGTVKASVSGNNVKVDASGFPLPGIRAGLCIGVAF